MKSESFQAELENEANTEVPKTAVLVEGGSKSFGIYSRFRSS